VFYSFYGLKAFEDRIVMGWPADLTSLEVSKLLHLLDKPLSEIELVEMALDYHQMMKEDRKSIHFYSGPPLSWMLDLKVPEIVRNYISELRNSVIPEDLFPVYTEQEYVFKVVDLVYQHLAHKGLELTEEDSAMIQLVQKKVEEDPNWANRCAHFLNSRYATKSPQFPGHAVFIRIDEDPISGYEKQKEDFELQHQGQNLLIHGSRSKSGFKPDIQAKAILTFRGASPLLTLLLESCQYHMVAEGLSLYLCEFELNVETYAQSFTPLRKDPGIGFAKRDQRWIERLEQRYSFVGYLFGSHNNGDTGIARMLNNHIFAEALTGWVEPNALMLIPSTVRRIFSWSRGSSEIYDSIDIDDEGMLRLPMTNALLYNSNASCAGISHLLPVAAMEVFYHKHLQLKGVSSYLAGFGDLTVLVSTNHQNGKYEGKLSSNFDVSRYDANLSGADCWYRMNQSDKTSDEFDVISTSSDQKVQDGKPTLAIQVQRPKNTSKPPAPKEAKKIQGDPTIHSWIGNWDSPEVKALPKGDRIYAFSRCLARKRGDKDSEDVRVVDQRWWTKLNPSIYHGEGWLMKYQPGRSLNPIFLRTDGQLSTKGSKGIAPMPDFLK